MNEKLLELLNQINAQKQKVVDLANAGKLKEAKTAKEELQKMQNKFDLLKDVLDQEPTADPADSRAVWSASSKHQQKSCDS